MKTGSLLAILLFGLVAVAHLVRLALDIQVTIGGAVAPMWISVVGVLVPAVVAWLLWREGRVAG